MADGGDERQVGERQLIAVDRLLETTLDGFILANARGQITDVNPAYCRMTGYSRDQLLAMSIFDLEARLGPDQIQDRIGKIMDAGRARFETQHRHCAGRAIDLDVSITVIELDGQPMVGAFVRDITEQKQLRTALEQSQKMEALGRLAGGIAHDFNNLLTVVLSHASLLRRPGRFPNEVAMAAAEIEDAAERAAALTRQLLTFSRRQQGRPTVVDPNVIVTSMSKLLGSMLGDDVSFETSLSPRVGGIEIDRSQLEQVILNLIVNSRDAMRGGGALSLRTSNRDVDAAFAARHEGATEGPFVAITVSDTGTGMSPEVLRRLFEPFFTTKGDAGTGLGLALVHGIVRQGGGFIVVHSEEGHGTTIDVFFPRVDKPDERAVLPARPVHLPSDEVRGRAILMVEDDESIRRITSRLLEAEGYQVVAVENAELALEVARNRDYVIDLLFTDIVLPGMSGIELAQEVCSLRPELRVLFTTGFSPTNLEGTGVAGPTPNRLDKPYSAEQLLLAIHNSLSR